MRRSNTNDLAREYFEAKMAAPVGRRQFLRLSSGLVVSTAAFGGISAFIAACSNVAAPSAAPTTAATAAPATAAPATAAPASASAKISGATIDWIGLDGEDGLKETEAWRKANGVELRSTYLGSDDEFAKIKAGEVFDIAIAYNSTTERFAAAGILQPVDTSRLTNYNDMFPNLRKGPFTAYQGQTYMIPIAWGDGPYIYNPAKVTAPPKSVRELLDPSWKGRLVGFDNPWAVFHTLAVSNGYPSPNLTKQQLDDVVTEAAVMVPYFTAFVGGYQDATDLLVRGEADLAFSGWEAMLTWGQEKGTKLAFAFLEEGHGGGWSDGFSIPANAVDIDAAYAYTDAVISPEINAQIAINLQSGTVNAKSLPLIDKKELAALYDYTLVSDESNPDLKFEIARPAEKPDAGIMSAKDWQDAWQRLRAGA